MNRNTKEILGNFELLLLLPSILLAVVTNFIKGLFLGENISDVKTDYVRGHYLFSSLAWLFLIALVLYQGQFTTITYVYACPDSAGSKCYKVKATYIPQDCEDTEWDNRGAHGGSCTDPYIEKIYFDNGGHVSFDSCDMESKDSWTCYSDTGDHGSWSIQISERVKIKK